MTSSRLIHPGVGSSPRGRGKLRGVLDGDLDLRLIPAWAGKTSSPRPRISAEQAHPRVGGENRLEAEYVAGPGGSSPRGRGKHHRHDRGRSAEGLIPAWAGKTRARCDAGWRRRAHPRVGGENSCRLGRSPPSGGSSPRGRGKPTVRRHSRRRAGLIPAWAGKTSSRPATTTGTWAHPRVGGENSPDSSTLPVKKGSSPRGRGKLAAALALACPGGAHPRVGGENGPPARGRLRDYRLIPAWAGKTSPLRVRVVSVGAHPRVGGENRVDHCAQRVGDGSSPRGRGKRRGTGGLAFARRLIPAWAGKTLPPRTLRAAPWAHPRVGGENLTTKDASGRPLGSSPRGRGKPDPHRRRMGAPGLIPAWAGKTLHTRSVRETEGAHPRVGGENDSV